MWFLSNSLNPMYMLAKLIAVLFMGFFISPLHEYAHGFAAYKLGDTTALRSGRLTLNPFHHVDYIGMVCMFFFGFGWAKPVPIDPRNFKNRKTGEAIVSAAGPLANLLAAVIGAVIFKIMFYFIRDPFAIQFIRMFLTYYIQLNIVIAVFNLLPIPSFDGFGIFKMFLSPNALQIIERNRTIINIAAMIAIFSGFLVRPLSRVVTIITNLIM